MDAGSFIGGIFIFLAVMLIGFALLAIAAFAFWVAMLIDCAGREFEREEEKIVWILVIVLLSLIGATAYYFAVKRSAKMLAKHKRKRR